MLKTRWTGSLAALIVVISTLAACGASSGDAAGDCAFKLKYEGQTYSALPGGTLRPVPTGAKIGQGVVVGCAGDKTDDQNVDVNKLEDVSPKDAVVVNMGTVAIADGVEMPEAVKVLSTPMPCRTGGQFNLNGLFTDFGADQQKRPTSAPFGLRLRNVQGGENVTQYDSSTLAIEVKSSTHPTLSDRDLKSLGEASKISATVSCDGDAFIAISMKLNGRAY